MNEEVRRPPSSTSSRRRTLPGGRRTRGDGTQAATDRSPRPDHRGRSSAGGDTRVLPADSCRASSIATKAARPTAAHPRPSVTTTSHAAQWKTGGKTTRTGSARYTGEGRPGPDRAVGPDRRRLLSRHVGLGGMVRYVVRLSCVLIRLCRPAVPVNPVAVNPPRPASPRPGPADSSPPRKPSPPRPPRPPSRTGRP